MTKAHAEFLEELKNYAKERAEFYIGRNHDRHCVYMTILAAIIKFQVEQKQVSDE